MKSADRQPCLCGCGGIPKNRRSKYCQGHYSNVGKTLSLETRRKISEGNKGKIIPIEVREKMSLAQTGKKRPDIRGENNPAKRPEVRVKLSANNAMKRPEVVAKRSGDNHYMKKPEYQKKMSIILSGRSKPWMLGDLNMAKKPEIRAKISANNSMKRPEVVAKLSGDNHYMRKKPEYRKHMSDIQTGSSKPWMLGDLNVSKKPEVRQKISQSKKGMPTPWTCVPMSAEVKAKISKTQKGRPNLKARGDNHWIHNNPEAVKRMRKAQHVRPNKPEVMLSLFLEENFPNIWEYTGDWGMVIEGRVPDFTSKDRKRIIELFGTYWHKHTDELHRTILYAKHGYQTLVIWEEELKNLKKLKERIKNFIGG